MKLIFDGKFKRRLLIFIFVAFVVYFLYRVRGVLFPFILAIILAYVLNPLVELLEQYKIRRLYGIIVVYATVLGLLFLVGFYGVPVIVKQLTAFGEKIPYYTSEAQSRLRDFYRDYQRFNIPESLRESIDQNIVNFQLQLTQLLSKLVTGIFNIFSQIFSFIIAPILAFYLLKDKDEISKSIVQSIPVANRSELLSLWEEIDTVLLKFIRGHLLVATLVGAATALGLALIGMDFPLLFGIISGITNIIPYFGPIIGAVPAILLALLQSETLALYVILVMAVVQQLESNLISPRILGQSVGLHPLLVIFVLLAGGELWGLVGMLIAVPLTAVLRILIGYLFTKLIA
ncbi:AI-2E family transporter [Zhaonella formicivorans]|uniref:AI-2E family transporter n=1 Tax=Zhaonella formicivorans TaxID=2528593 RepID=UPI001D11F6A7|nr:AI-2E family transporter [Zhaonella formicivorans]